MDILPGTLRFAEYLKKLPPAKVIGNFFNDNTSSRKILSSAMIDDCVRNYSTPEVLRQRFLSLDAKEQLRCAQIYLMGSIGSVGVGTGDPVVEAFLGYAARNQEGEVRIFGFEEFEPALRELFVSTIMRAEISAEDSHVSTPICRWRFCNDIALTAALASQHLLIRKKSGQLGKTAVQLIKKFISGGEMYKIGEAEKVVELIISYCIEKRFLHMEDTEYRFCFSPFSEWLSLPLDQKINDITAFFISRCGGWNRELMLQLGKTASPRWISEVSFPEKDRQRFREILLIYNFINLLEIRVRGHELYFRNRRESPLEPHIQEKQIIIMPDFNVVIKQECVPEDLFYFASFCRLYSLDHVYHGIIEKEILIESHCSHMEEEKIIGSLNKWDSPINVIESVREWLREFRRVSLITENIIITADEKVTEQISGFDQLKAFIEPISAYAVFRIKPGTEKKVRDIIRKLGFDERTPSIKETEPSASDGSVTIVNDTRDERKWSVIIDNESYQKTIKPVIRGTKYGAELKSLELSDTVQVIDYAILTSQRIVISYDGSPYLRKGVYTLIPIVCSRGPEPMLEAQLQSSGSRKQFHVKKIGAIGVVPE